MALKITAKISAKLAGKVPPVTQEEIEQCFATRTRGYLTDTREDHLTNPITRWFISETYFGRKLKIAFIPLGNDIHIRTAYEPSAKELEIYLKNSTVLPN